MRFWCFFGRKLKAPSFFFANSVSRQNERFLPILVILNHLIKISALVFHSEGVQQFQELKILHSDSLCFDERYAD